MEKTRLSYLFASVVKRYETCPEAQTLQKTLEEEVAFLWVPVVLTSKVEWELFSVITA